MQQDKGETSSFPVEGEASSSSTQNTGPPQEKEMLGGRVKKSQKCKKRRSISKREISDQEQVRNVYCRPYSMMNEIPPALYAIRSCAPSPRTGHLPKSGNMFPGPSLESIYKVPGEDTTKIQPFDANTPHGASSSSPNIHFPPPGLDSTSDLLETELIEGVHKDIQTIMKEVSPGGVNEKPLDPNAFSSSLDISSSSEDEKWFNLWKSGPHFYPPTPLTLDELIRSHSSDEQDTVSGEAMDLPMHVSTSSYTGDPLGNKLKELDKNKQKTVEEKFSGGDVCGEQSDHNPSGLSSLIWPPSLPLGGYSQSERELRRRARGRRSRALTGSSLEDNFGSSLDAGLEYSSRPGGIEGSVNFERSCSRSSSSTLSPPDKRLRLQSADEILTKNQGSSGTANPLTSGFDHDITSDKKQGLVQPPTGSMGHQTQGEPSTAELSLPADSDPQQTFELFPETGRNRTSALPYLHRYSRPSQTEGVSGLSGLIECLTGGPYRPPEQPQNKHTDHHRTPEEMFRSAYIRYSLPGRSLTVDSDFEQTHVPPPITLTDQSGYHSEAVVKQEAAVAAVSCSVTNTQPIQTCSSGPSQTEGVSESLSGSHSSPSLSHMTSAENRTLTRAQSLPDLQLNCSCEQFTPDISADEEDETYRFQCSSPGLYQCSVTGLVFHMEREGDLVYRTLPWNRKLLSQHHKQPAGPLFDIKCEQQSVCQLHLPHCEIHSTGGADFLSVAHLNEENIEFIVPHKITETHVIINITGFSAFGNVKDEDSPPDPVRALVLVFYRPPADPHPTSLLNVLLLPKNVLIPDVIRFRKKLIGYELYIEKPPDCKLQPQQEYSLSTCPEDDSVLVEPTTAEFYSDNYENYSPSFQVTLENTMTHLKLILRDTNSSKSVWERRVCLSSSRVQRSCGQSALTLPPNQRLLDIRSSFIAGISGPVLKSLLDKLLEKTVMTDSEVESADEMRNRGDKARFVIDTVRNKGEAASSEMMEALCDLDPFFSEHLGLT